MIFVPITYFKKIIKKTKLTKKVQTGFYNLSIAPGKLQHLIRITSVMYPVILCIKSVVYLVCHVYSLLCSLLCGLLCIVGTGLFTEKENTYTYL